MRLMPTRGEHRQSSSSVAAAAVGPSPGVRRCGCTREASEARWRSPRASPTRAQRSATSCGASCRRGSPASISLRLRAWRCAHRASTRRSTRPWVNCWRRWPDLMASCMSRLLPSSSSDCPQDCLCEREAARTNKGQPDEVARQVRARAVFSVYVVVCLLGLEGPARLADDDPAPLSPLSTSTGPTSTSTFCATPLGAPNTLAHTTRKSVLTLTPCRAEQKTSGAPIALAYARACRVVSRRSSAGRLQKKSYLVPTSTGVAATLFAVASLYHRLTLESVERRPRSNMNRKASASLHTSGSVCLKSCCEPGSHTLKTTSVSRTGTVFSMKLTPSVCT
mmetsp:Transcript_6007/g.18054  ORF Transcript_6007/g.18054 Transcript_6007/m.18054 type:complete len:336 (+) Transcript_6007:194-1201(+)